MSFLPSSQLSNLLAGLIALVPAALSALWGRTLARVIDDPALNERLMAHRVRNLRVTSIAVAVLAVALPVTLMWSLPLLVLARAIVAFPLRRKLFGETWTFTSYLACGIRLYVALLGFWILLAVVPWLTGGARWLWWVASLWSLLLVAWDWWYSAIVLKILGARPLLSDALKPRFTSVVERSTISAPRVWRAGPQGANIANALALSSLAGGSVLISETLLERLTEDETTAIFAHEVAHLEHFNRLRLWRGHLAVLGLILAATVLVPLAQGVSLQLVGSIRNVWPLFIFASLLIKVRRAQENEYASDLRAVQLSGDAEVLINALTKLHTIGRVPRRWDLEMETSASHPSLARRIRTIRAAGQAQDTVLDPELFRAAKPGVFVVFQEEHLRLFRDVPSECAVTLQALQSASGTITSMRFNQIAELRVAARGMSSPELIIVNRNGERRAMQMRGEDLPRLQRTLDRVDVLLAPVPRSLYTGRLIASLSATTAALVALVVAQLWSVTLVTLIAACRPTPSLVLAAAAASIVATALILVREPSGVGMGLKLAVGILPLVAVAVRMRLHSSTEKSPASGRPPNWLLWSLGLAALAAASVPFVAAQGSLLCLTQTSRAMVASAALPLAMAVVLLQLKSSRLRWMSTVFAIAGLVPIVVGARWFRDDVVRDPLVVSLPAFAVVDILPGEVSSFAVDSWVSSLRLAPKGTRVAIRYGDSDDEEASAAFAVYSLDGSRRTTLEAVDAQFLDETHILVLRAAPSDLTLDLLEEGSTASSSIWHSELALVHTGRLAVDPETGRWRVLTQSREGRLLRFEGLISQGNVIKTEWSPPSQTAPWLARGIAGSGPEALWLCQRWKTNRFVSLTSLFAPLSGGYPVDSSLYISSKNQTSLVTRSGASVTCLDPPIGESEPVCFASHDDTTNVFTVDTTMGRAKPVGAVRGSFWTGSLGASGTFAASFDADPALLQLKERRLLRISSSRTGATSGVTCSAGSIAGVESQNQGSKITVYRLGESIGSEHAKYKR